jgi:tetratricopeptide (TPR) repeat protein
VIRRFRELALDRMVELDLHELVAREATLLLDDDAPAGRKSPAALYLLRARAELALGRPQEALRDFGRIPPTWTRGLDAECWLALARPASALACARRSRNLFFGAGHHQDELVGRALLALGRFDEARGAFERARGLGGAACARCLGGLALALTAEGAPSADERARAERLVARASEIAGEAPEVLRARAALARLGGDRTSANALDARARAFADPRAASRIDALRNRAHRALARSRWGEAARDATELLAERPLDGDALRTLADACVRGHHPFASLPLELLGERERQDAWVALKRGKARAEEGRLDDARADLERALALFRGSLRRSPLRLEAQVARAELK